MQGSDSESSREEGAASASGGSGEAEPEEMAVECPVWATTVADFLGPARARQRGAGPAAAQGGSPPKSLLGLKSPDAKNRLSQSATTKKKRIYTSRRELYERLRDKVAEQGRKDHHGAQAGCPECVFCL